jgi:signal transduction histidine kinase
VLPRLATLSILLVLVVVAVGARAEETPLTDCAAVRSLSKEAAARRLPVQLRGVVTFSYPRENTSFVLQTRGEGTYVERGEFARAHGLVPTGWSWPGALPAGTVIEMNGVTGPGDYAPVIYPQHIRIVGTAPLPEATPLPISELLDGKWDCQRVRVRGVVQFTETTPPEAQAGWCELVAHGGRVRVRINRLDSSASLAHLADAEVEVAGVMFVNWNSRGELLGARLNIDSVNDLQVIERGPDDPFSVPALNLSEIQPFSRDGSTLHRRRCTGTVTLAWPGRGPVQSFFIQEGRRGVCVETSDQTPLAPGDRVEASGFVQMKEDFGMIHAAVVRKLGTAPLPAPIPVDRRLILGRSVEGRSVTDAKDVDGMLATIDGRLEKIDVADRETPRLLLSSEGRLVAVSFNRETPAAAFDRFEPGSLLRIVGVVRVELASSWPAQEHPYPVNYGFLVPSLDDVTVISAAPWWTPQRLWLLLGGIGAVLVFTLAWNWLLRRRVEQRSTQLAEEMRARREAAVEFDATLRERQRLAADLHDTLEQGLTGIAFRVETMIVQRTKAQDNSENLDRVRHLLSGVREDVRRSVWNLRADALEGHTLAEALQATADRLAGQSDLIVAVETEGAPLVLPDLIAGNLLLLAQEAMTNALKHGEPRSILVRLAFTADTVRLTVEDDGRGFDPAQAATPREGHFGIQGMRERAKRLGGTLEVDSAPGRGTRIIVKVPVHAPEPAVART